MRAFLKVMKALSDQNRVKIVKMLQRREIQATLGIAQPTVSKIALFGVYFILRPFIPENRI